MHFQEYLQIIRKLSGNRAFGYIKILGIALAISGVLLISLWVYDELSFNKCHDNYALIAKVMIRNKLDSGGMYTNDVVTAGMGTLLKTSYGDHFSKIAMVRARTEERVLATGENKFKETGYFLQSQGPDILSLKMISGVREGLKETNTIFLAQSTAKKLFGKINPMGQSVLMDGMWNLTVTGVYEDIPKNSDFGDAHYFAPLARYLEGWSDLNVWNNYNMYILVQ